VHLVGFTIEAFLPYRPCRSRSDVCTYLVACIVACIVVPVVVWAVINVIKCLCKALRNAVLT